MTSDNVRHELDQIIGATASLALELELMRGVYDAAMDYVRNRCGSEYDDESDLMTHNALLVAVRKAMEDEEG